MNYITPEFIKARGLVAGSIQDLNNHSGCIPINGAGGKRTEPLGYVMIRVQIPQVLSYDEDQVALIIEDPSLFSRRYPIILGTPTIFQPPSNERIQNAQPRTGLAVCEGRI